MGLSKYDREHFDEIVGGMGNWFMAHLIRLYCKADMTNRDKLAQVYPDLAKAYDQWFHGEEVT